MENFKDNESKKLLAFQQEAILSASNFNNSLEKDLLILQKDLNSHRGEYPEATISDRYEDLLKKYLKILQVEYKPIHEAPIKIYKDDGEEEFLFKNAGTKNGRIDSRFNYIIHEFKKDITVNLPENIKQLDTYIRNLVNSDAETEINPSIDKYYGILTDGMRIVFLNYSSEERIVSQVNTLNIATIKEVFKIFASFGHKELSSKQLVKDFAFDAENPITLELAKSLYKNLICTGKTQFTSAWEQIFQLGGHNDNNNKTIVARKKVLANLFETTNTEIEESEALFALQTSYVIIIKLIARNTLADNFFGSKNEVFTNLLEQEGNSFRNALRRVDNGFDFKMVHLINLIESDFFSWYLEDGQWNKMIENRIKDIVRTLDEYVSSQRVYNRNNVHDIFKELYQAIIPQEVRHSLGEYYTPDWLADHLVSTKLDTITKINPNWRGLEPDIGSGTIALKMIEKLIHQLEAEGADDEKILENVLSRIHGHDLNPLAVLTARINYFLLISRYIDLSKGNDIFIPVNLGDSALVPTIISEDGNEFISYTVIDANNETVEFLIPKKIVEVKSYYVNYRKFLDDLEFDASLATEKTLKGSISLNTNEEQHLKEFVQKLKNIVDEGMGVSWASTVLSIIGTIVIGKFDLIASNPPWIDWKVLPDGYREVLKKASLEKHIFSGDRLTGGINLNLCALITNVVADTWLSDTGELAFLMPKSLMVQQTYTGFRKLTQSNSSPLYYDYFVDWTKAGKPFDPVAEKFMSYYFTKRKPLEATEFPVLEMKKIGKITRKYKSWEAIKDLYSVKEMLAFQASDVNNNFSITETSDSKIISDMKKIAGKSFYKGRVGLGLYPKEGLLMKIIDSPQNNETQVLVTSYQNKNSERPIGAMETFVETEFLHPVIEGPNIGRFKLKDPMYFAALPYEKSSIKTPLSQNDLGEKAPKLLQRYRNIKDDIKKTDYNQKVQGKKGEFYSVTRVGEYTFSPYRVAYRNNTKWNGVVIESAKTEWGNTPYLLLDHACSVSQNIKGKNITLDEAHYICAIINSKIVEKYILASSDVRSFKSDLPIEIVEYDEENELHQELAEISMKFHKGKHDETELDEQLSFLMNKYISDLD